MKATTRPPLRCRVLGHSWHDEPNPTGLIGAYFRCRRCPTWEVLRAGACGDGCVIRERGTHDPTPCPECEAGKCGNCDGRTWDRDADDYTVCPCAGAGHG